MQILDPQLMASVTDLPAVTVLADEASTRLNAVLATSPADGAGRARLRGIDGTLPASRSNGPMTAVAVR